MNPSMEKGMLNQQYVDGCKSQKVQEASNPEAMLGVERKRLLLGQVVDRVSQVFPRFFVVRRLNIHMIAHDRTHRSDLGTQNLTVGKVLEEASRDESRQ